MIYTALAWRNKSFGQALEFVWGDDSNVYAVRESASTSACAWPVGWLDGACGVQLGHGGLEEPAGGRCCRWHQRASGCTAFLPGCRQVAAHGQLTCTRATLPSFHTTVKIHRNFKEALTVRVPFAAEAIFGGQLLGVRAQDFIVFYDWATGKVRCF